MTELIKTVHPLEQMPERKQEQGTRGMRLSLVGGVACGKNTQAALLMEK